MCDIVHMLLFTWKEYVEHSIAMRKKGILLPAATWTDPEGTMLSVISQTEKDKYFMVYSYEESFFKKSNVWKQ